MKLYSAGGRLFQTLEEACSYASFIHKVSRLIVAVEEVTV